MNRIVWLCIMLCFTLPVFSQIKGVVFDKKTQEPLPDAYILTDSGSYVTNPSGRFMIQSAVKTLIVNHLGYLPDTLIIGSEDTLVNIQLISTTTLLGQITIRGNLQKTTVLQMPSSIGYISNLEQQLPNTISYIESLNQVPGVYAQTGAYNTNRITIRGIGSRTPYATNRIKAYYNEIPLTTGDGTTEIEDLNVSSIGSVEILKGSKSALYGSGLGGVVVLNHPKYTDGIHGYARLDVASYQSITLGAGLQYRQKGFFAGVDYSDVRSEGWRENSEYHRRNFNLNTGFSWTKSMLELTLLAIDTRANIPSSLNEEQLINTPESAAQNWLEVKGYESYTKLIGGIKFKHYFNDNLQNAIHLFVHRYEGYESRPFNILDDDSQNWGLRNITSLQLTKFKVQLGIETLFENYSWGIYETLSGIQGQQKQQFSERRNPLTIFINGQYQVADPGII
ncbi:MAG: TonB-dependent receptor [Bacteroidales bacterium]